MVFFLSVTKEKDFPKGKPFFVAKLGFIVRIVLIAMTVACDIRQTHTLTLPTN